MFPLIFFVYPAYYISQLCETKKYWIEFIMEKISWQWLRKLIYWFGQYKECEGYVVTGVDKRWLDYGSWIAKKSYWRWVFSFGDSLYSWIHRTNTSSCSSKFEFTPAAEWPPQVEFYIVYQNSKGRYLLSICIFFAMFLLPA